MTSVDADASRIGLQVLKRGGNAADAAVATAAALGVTEPYSAGIGGGGYFVHYDARTGKVRTIDGRETAPRTIPARRAFLDPDTGKPYEPFFPNLVTSGVSVGMPGTLATWQRALRPLGHPVPGAEPARRRPGSRATASWSTRPSTTRPRTTRSASGRSPPPAGSSCAAATCRGSAPASATPTWPTPTT